MKDSGRNHGGAEWVLEGQFLHEEIDPRVHFKAVEVVGVPLEPHEETSIRHVGRAERWSMFKVRPENKGGISWNKCDS